MSVKVKILITFLPVTLWLIGYTVLKDYLPPEWMFLLMMLSMVAVLAITLFAWKQWEKETEQQESEFREKHPPVSVTRFPNKRK